MKLTHRTAIWTKRKPDNFVADTLKSRPNKVVCVCVGWKRIENRKKLCLSMAQKKNEDITFLPIWKKRQKNVLTENIIYSSKKCESFKGNWHQRNQNRTKQWRNFSNGGSNQWDLFCYRHHSRGFFFPPIFNLMFRNGIQKKLSTDIPFALWNFRFFYIPSVDACGFIGYHLCILNAQHIHTHIYY